MARPTDLSAELADRICQSIRAGVPVIHAAEGNGVGRSTYFQWVALGKEADECGIAACADRHHGPVGDLCYAEFADMVMAARADAVRLAVGYVVKAMGRDPVNARWWLERMHPEIFKLRSEIEAKLDEQRHRPPLIIQVVPSDRPQEEIDELMRDSDLTRSAATRMPVTTAAGDQDDEGDDLFDDEVEDDG